MEETNQKLDRILTELERTNVAVRIPGIDLVAKLQDIPDRLGEIPDVIRKELEMREKILFNMLLQAWEQIYTGETRQTLVDRIRRTSGGIVQFVRDLFGTINAVRTTTVVVLIALVAVLLLNLATNIAILTRKITLVVTIPIVVITTLYIYRFLYPIMANPPDEKHYKLTWRSPDDLQISPEFNKE